MMPFLIDIAVLFVSKKEEVNHLLDNLNKCMMGRQMLYKNSY